MAMIMKMMKTTRRRQYKSNNNNNDDDNNSNNNNNIIIIIMMQHTSNAFGPNSTNISKSPLLMQTNTSKSLLPLTQTFNKSLHLYSYTDRARLLTPHPPHPPTSTPPSPQSPTNFPATDRDLRFTQLPPFPVAPIWSAAARRSAP